MNVNVFGSSLSIVFPLNATELKYEGPTVMTDLPLWLKGNGNDIKFKSTIIVIGSNTHLKPFLVFLDLATLFLLGVFAFGFHSKIQVFHCHRKAAENSNE